MMRNIPLANIYNLHIMFKMKKKNEDHILFVVHDLRQVIEGDPIYLIRRPYINKRLLKKITDCLSMKYSIKYFIHL